MGKLIETCSSDRERESFRFAQFQGRAGNDRCSQSLVKVHESFLSGRQAARFFAHVSGFQVMRFDHQHNMPGRANRTGGARSGPVRLQVLSWFCDPMIDMPSVRHVPDMLCPIIRRP